MANWILILTVFYSGESVHVDHIDFSSRALCLQAGNLWQDAVRKSSANAVRDAVAVCVPK